MALAAPARPVVPADTTLTRGGTASRPLAFAALVALLSGLALSSVGRLQGSATLDLLSQVAVVCGVAASVGLSAVARNSPTARLPVGAVLLLAAATGLVWLAPVPVELVTQAETVRFATPASLVGALVWWLVSQRAPRASSPSAAVPASLRMLVALTGAALLAQLVVGAYVRASGATWACVGFPDCNGAGILPFGAGGKLADIQLVHRALAYLSVGLVGWSAVAARGSGPEQRRLRRLAGSLVLAVLAQGTLGALLVGVDVTPALRLLHTAGGLVTWLLAAALAAEVWRLPLQIAPLVPGGGGTVPPPASMAPRNWRTYPRAYLALSKPGVMLLLLATTLGAMVVAANGMPALGLVFWTLLGGAFATGGAGAINHYLDRDIDPRMGGRTSRRPIPSGIVRPEQALTFGVVLGVLGFLVLAAFVNVLAALLAMAGLFGYVFVYTLWLKRSTPSNIVIGGAAGAIPPMVGWAAVTNEVGLTSLYLFAVVFFWTPPHFWALALMIREHYQAANIPMLPVVRGDAETRWQILLYSLLLVALTVLLFSFRLMGLFYLGGAVLLGGVFVYLAARLWREATRAAARRLYLYSLFYLAALFTVMAVDRAAFS